MGIEQKVVYPGGAVPSWPAVQETLARAGFPVQTRMIDGQLAFPDEVPGADWQELRLGTSQGMVTVRRGPGEVVLLTWGNADRALAQAWNAVAWAFAEAGGGRVQAAGGPLSAADYRRTADLPEALRGPV